jgi:pimeloyl-ACP methyl ester carboxylesterase
MHHLTLIPGLASDATLFQDLWAALAARHRVHLSDVHFRFGTIPEMATALLNESPGAQVLVGSSMGGMIALEAQRQAPDRVQALVLLGSSARADTPEMIALRTNACELFEQGRMDEVLRANVAMAFHPANVARPGLVDSYLNFVRRAGAAQLVRQNRAVMQRVDSRPLLASVRCPTLVVCGEADLLTPPAHSREIAAAVPGARLEILPGCGHLLTMEQPDRVNAVLLPWLQALPAR